MLFAKRSNAADKPRNMLHDGHPVRERDVN